MILCVDIEHMYSKTSSKADSALVPGSKDIALQPCMSIGIPRWVENRRCKDFGQVPLPLVGQVVQVLLQGQDQAARMSDSVCQSRAKTKSRS